MIINSYRYGSGAPTITPQYDPSNTHSSITLSLDNRRATGNANSGGLTRCLPSKSTGKWYAEIELNVFSAAAGTGGVGIIGLSTPGEALSNWVGQGAGGCSLWRVNTFVRTYLAGASTDPALSIAVGGRARIAWDADAGKVWWGCNGTMIGDAAAGAGASYTSASLQGEHFLASGPRNFDNQVTIPSTYIYTPPTGFSPWLAE